ncbi:chloride channel protein [Desulfatiglans anilini]|uniref:chloride channel protein n=1 Tax=Desulfatiglans anilini TaxID=90728 RepID=UPI000406EC7E|nr:chloride channel protein [Desulfatiglans anilini]
MHRLLLRLDERLQLVLISCVVGVCGGLLSVLLNRSLHAFAGWVKPLSGEIYAVLFPAAGAMLSWIFLNYVMREKGGHGVPDVIQSVSRRGGLLPFRTSFSRLVSALLTIGSGGSAGPEGPVVISGGSIGSNIATFFGLKDRQRVVIVGCGASAAIGAIFNAPVAGIAFTLEVILGEWAPVNLIPIAMASVVGTSVSRLLQGNQIPFEHQAFPVAGLDLVACIGLALFTTGSSVGLMRMVSTVHTWSTKWVSAGWMRAGLGGLMVGGIGMFLPAVLGEGYEVIREILRQQISAGVGMVALLVAAKILVTGLTLGSGGSGGLFAPCLVVGCFTGLFYQRALVWLMPSVEWAGESYFALLGMAGVISSVMQAPMTGIFLISEITGGYEVLLSVVLVSVLSVSVSSYIEPVSVYHRDLVATGEFIRPGSDRKILSDLNVAELLETDCVPLHPEMLLKDLVARVEQGRRNYFPVEDPENGRFLGMVHLDDVREFLFHPDLYHSVLVEEVMQRDVPTVSLDDDLGHVFQLFDEERVWSLPVVHGDGRFAGLISKATILDHYRRELMAQQNV